MVGAESPQVEASTTTTDTVPYNLPTAASVATPWTTAPTIEQEGEHEVEDIFTDIEDYAHRNHILLSSDAIRTFVRAHGSDDGVLFALGKVIENAKAKYPSEDGWLVLNHDRMEELLQNGHAGSAAVSGAALDETTGVGSLAEAIVTGNVAASYRMIAHRPMVALADAAADLDTIYRLKQGSEATREPSELLKQATQNYSAEEVAEMIRALTTALDGTYTDEESAVKMAVMKAISVGS